MKESISTRETPPSSLDLWIAFINFMALSLIASPSSVAINLLTASSTAEAATTSSLWLQSFTTSPILSTSVTSTLFLG
ncbi:hypothetical protein Ahy_B06g080287 [Arachis hypogaea]|uniref:Uncharacterized protein n=1 Tax=Arachis hypogaea TaxID=3818 RepID=A0A444YHM0_ARAHY|nr:hypothetical protein Ahy_B06g080287 [Arachis hypogaea]